MRSGAKVVLAFVILGGSGGCRDATLPPEAGLRFGALAVGPTHACAVDLQGAAYCWGNGQLGELGTTTPQSSGTPVAVKGAPVLRDVGAGYSHSCGLTVDGSVYCWGWGIQGQLGNGAFGSSPPVKVVGEHRFASISSGWYHACGVAEGGSIYCWGNNSNGQLGDGTTINRDTPVAVVRGTLRFASVSAGARHTCALTTTGAGYCWGANDVGQVGAAVQGDARTPVSVVNGSGWRAITAGATHSCALTAAGVALCWGSNAEGELGNRSLQREGIPGSAIPAPIAMDVVGSAFQSISGGKAYTCGVAGGTGYCWGRGLEGQLGDGFVATSPLPRPVAGPSGPAGPDRQNFVSIAAGGLTYACGLTSQNAVFCWGTGNEGQLGMSGITTSGVPVRVTGAN